MHRSDEVTVNGVHPYPVRRFRGVKSRYGFKVNDNPANRKTLDDFNVNIRVFFKHCCVDTLDLIAPGTDHPYAVHREHRVVGKILWDTLNVTRDHRVKKPLNDFAGTGHGASLITTTVLTRTGGAELTRPKYRAPSIGRPSKNRHHTYQL